MINYSHVDGKGRAKRQLLTTKKVKGERLYVTCAGILLIKMVMVVFNRLFNISLLCNRDRGDKRLSAWGILIFSFSSSEMLSVFVILHVENPMATVANRLSQQQRSHVVSQPVELIIFIFFNLRGKSNGKQCCRQLVGRSVSMCVCAYANYGV